MRERLLLALLLTVAGPLVLESAAWTCSQPSPCGAFALADAVFMGEVIDVREVAEGNWRVVHLRVSRVWKGKVAPVVSIGGPELEVGQKWLIYGRGEGPAFNFVPCSFSRMLSPDVDLSKLPPVAGRISGHVYNWRWDETSTDQDADHAIAAARVWFETPAGRRETVTDAQGRFAFDGVPTGEVTLHVDAGPALEPEGEHTFHLGDPSDCGDVVIAVKPSGRIQGSVVNADGRAAAGIGLALYDRASLSAVYGGSARTDEAGRFEFVGVGPGDYLIGLGGPHPRGSFPYARTYYPGVRDPADAHAVGVDAGHARQLDASFVMPSALPTREVAVGVTCDDGSVPLGISIDARPDREGETPDSSQSAQAGRVMLVLMLDAGYVVNVRRMRYEPSLVGSSPFKVEMLGSLRVEAGAAVPVLHLSLPAATCR